MSPLETVKGREPLVGWRGWDIAMPHYLTTGTGSTTVWLPNETTEAICRTHRYHRLPSHERGAPVLECSCGIYAFKTPWKLRKDNYLNQSLLGEVWLWGRIIEHEQGFRAEYAYPKALYLPTPDTMRPHVGAYNDIVTNNDAWDLRRMEAEMVAFRYNIPFSIIDATHPIFSKTQQELEQEAKERAQAAAARAQKLMGTREYNKKLREAAMKLPSNFPSLYKNLWEEIEVEAQTKALAKQAKGRKP